jgi:O-antigen ligase
MSFAYPFLNFLQPGDLWLALAAFRPMLVASVVIGLLCLRPTAKPEPPLLVAYLKHPAMRWLALFVVIQAISVYYSGVTAMMNEFVVWATYLLYVAVSLMTIRDAATFRRYIWGTMIGSGFVIFYGLYAVAVHAPTIVEGRAGAYGMYENQNDYSFIILMILPFAWLYTRICRGFWQRLLLVALVTGCVSGILLSLSRGGILALMLELGMLVWLSVRGRRRVWVLVALVLIGTGAVVHQFAAREANQAGQYTEEDSETSRYELWRAARAVFVAHPLLGVGSRRFAEYASDYAEISHDNRGKVTHNTYLEVLADTGLLGFCAFMLLLRAVWKPLRGAKIGNFEGDGIAEARMAALISFGTFLFRALLDAKVQDWTLYFLAVVAVSIPALLKKSVAATAGVPRSRRKSRPLAAPARSVLYRRR